MSDGRGEDPSEAVLVTIVGPRRRADVVLPGSSPIAELVGPCAEMVAAGPGEAGTAWGLAPLGRQALAPDTTLDAAGIGDGAVLYLRPLAPERPEPFVAVSSSFLEDDGGPVAEPDRVGGAGRRRLLLFAAGLTGLAGLEGALLTRLASGNDHPVPAAVVAGAVAVALAVAAGGVAGGRPGD